MVFLFSEGFVICVVFNLFMGVKKTLLMCNLCEIITSHVFILYGNVKILYFNTKT